jgi:hypothetical protein
MYMPSKMLPARFGRRMAHWLLACVWANGCLPAAAEQVQVHVPNSRPLLMLAKVNPFATKAVPVAAPPLQVPARWAPPVDQPSVVATQTTSTATPMGLDAVFAGQITLPSGERKVYVLQQEQFLTLGLGSMLPNGYVVKSISPTDVTFTHPSNQHMTKLYLPSTPLFESR